MLTEKFLEDMCKHMTTVQHDITVMLSAGINKETEDLLRCMRSDMIGLEDRIQGTLH